MSSYKPTMLGTLDVCWFPATLFYNALLHWPLDSLSTERSYQGAGHQCTKEAGRTHGVNRINTHTNLNLHDNFHLFCTIFHQYDTPIHFCKFTQLFFHPKIFKFLYMRMSWSTCNAAHLSFWQIHNFDYFH